MPYLSEVDGQKLLQLARQALVEIVTRRELPASISHEGIFGERRGAFVTLHVGGELRGCIGTTEVDEPLGDAVVRCAASAALHDARFAAVRAEELGELRIEISVLSPVAAIRVEDIEIGKHGLVISDGAHRGLLLPQVAVEHGLSVEQFLGETCRKAGLAREAWRLGKARIEGFTCDVFAEEA